MPLINVFLWIMLILAASVCYQLLCSYHQNEKEINKSSLVLHGGNRPALSEPRLVNADYTRVRTYVHGVDNSMNPSEKNTYAAFFEVADHSSTDTSNRQQIEFYFPVAQQKDEPSDREKMAAVSDCHHCA